MSASQDNGAEPTTDVIPLDNGLALVVGEMPESWVALPDTFLGRRENEVLSGLLASTGAVNVGLQAANTWQQSANLVRVAPETMAALKTGTPLMKDGWNLGTVMANGKFAHQVRWLPAGGANAAGVAASAGMALTLIAIQAQIAEVAAIAQETLEVSRDTLQEIRSDRWNQTRALLEVMAGGIREATMVGGCTDGVWANVAGRDYEIRKARRDHLSALGDRLREFDKMGGAVERSKWMERNGAATLHDAELLMMSNQAWLMYSALRVSHLGQDEDRNRVLIDEILTAVRHEHAAATRTAIQLIDRVHSSLDVLVDRPGRALLPVGKTRRAAKDVRRLAEIHRDALERMAVEPVQQLVPVPELPDVRVGQATGSSFERTRRRLRWILDEGEPLKALATADLDGAKKIVAVTSERVLVAHAEALIERGDTSMMLQVPVDEIRYVRLTDQGRKDDALLRITCRDQDIDLVFGGRRGNEELTRLHDVLRLEMTLPEEETGRVEAPQEQFAVFDAS